MTLDHVALARSTAEETLTGSVTFRRADSEPTFDPVTGTTTATDTVVWAGACSVYPKGQGVAVEGAEPTSLNAYRMRVPVAASDVQRGDVATISTVGAAGDPDLVGRPLVVEEIDNRTTSVLRTLVVVDRDRAARL